VTRRTPLPSAEAAGGPVDGVWCPSCLLATVVAIPVLIRPPMLGDAHLEVAQVCTRCGEEGNCR
jgi:hypothetical protein